MIQNLIIASFFVHVLIGVFFMLWLYLFVSRLSDKQCDELLKRFSKEKECSHEYSEKQVIDVDGPVWRFYCNKCNAKAPY